MVQWNTANISHSLSLVNELRFSAFRNRKILAFFFSFHTHTGYNFEFIVWFEFQGFRHVFLSSLTLSSPMYEIWIITISRDCSEMTNVHTLPGTGPDK